MLAMLLGVVGGVMLAPLLSKDKKGGTEEHVSKLEELTRLIDNEYVDKIESDSAQSAMLNGLLMGMDPHSHYFSKEELSKQEEELQGGFDGIGVVLRHINDTVRANQVMEGSPAARAGVEPGDRIIKVDTTTVSGVKMKSDDVVKKIRGNRGTKVVLTLERYGESKPLRCEITRDAINTPSVPYSGMIDGKTGYIKVTKFIGPTYRDFHKALATLKEQGMSRLIIDLRGNGGGLLEIAVQMANDLLDKGDLIVYTDGAHQRRRNTYSDREAFYSGEVVVMIDEMSASASEVVAGAIQDNDRGIIVGRRSFGKGLVQQQFDLADGSAVWLTIARYYTPSGRCIQRPYDKGTDEYYTSYLTRMLEEMESDSIVSELTDSTKYYTKKGRVVYGGGGIFPDKVLSYLKDSNLIYFNALLNKSCMHDLALDYVAKNLKELRKNYPSADAFVKNFEVSDVLLQELVAYGERKNAKYDAKSARKYDKLIRTTLKAYIADNLFGTATFYKIYATTDHELAQVLGSKTTKTKKQ